MTASSPSLPEGLRDRVLSASQDARTGGRAVPLAPGITPTEAFARSAYSFLAVLASLDAVEWRMQVLRDLDVQGLVGHLTGVERDVQRAIEGDPDVADIDHVVSTDPVAVAQAGRDPWETRAEWRSAVERTLAMAAGVRRDGAVLSMHGMRLTVDALLVVRAFELWTHENDIRAVVGLPRSAPDASTLTLMTDLAVRLLPHGVTRTKSLASAVDLHLVLTGAGGGTWDLPLGSRTPVLASNDLMIVVDAVDFCRLVANRITPESLDLQVEGAPAAAHGVLVGAASLALD